MATYIYETTDETRPPRRFEIVQSMKDTALTRHPDTGEPIRRVITGGYGLLAKAGTADETARSSSSNGPGTAGGCGTSCGCH